MLKFFAGLTACFVVLCAGYALASRNSSGTMSAANGPYVPGTTITSTTINSRFADIENEITDSLSRSGKGGMTAALRGSDGTVAAPEFSFTNETGSGMYRIGASDLGWAIAGTKKLELTGSLFSTAVAQTNTIAAGAAFTGLSGAAGSNVTIGIGRTVAEGTLAVSAGANQFAQGSAAGDIVFRTTGSKLWVDTNNGSGTPSLAIAAANGGVIIGGGTAISASYRGTTVWDPASTTNGQATTTITVTGAAAGADCVVTPPSTIATPFSIATFCYVTLNTCNIGFWSIGTNDLPSATWACRVFNP